MKAFESLQVLRGCELISMHLLRNLLSSVSEIFYELSHLLREQSLTVGEFPIQLSLEAECQ